MQQSRLITRLARDESGQDLIEYGLPASLISLSSVAAILALGRGITEYCDYLAGEIP